MRIDVVPNGEIDMFYSGSSCEDRCIGHLRIDFGSDEEFYHTWWPHSADSLKTVDMREDLKCVLDTLRKNLLKSLPEMRKYHAEHPAQELEEGSRGYHVETDHYEYFVRCAPMPGNYNCYIYCYIKNMYEKNEGRCIHVNNPEFSKAQIERIDEVHNATFDFIKVLTEQYDMEWDMSLIGEVADMAADFLASQGYKVRYPAIVGDGDGGQQVIDYCN